MGGRLEAVEGLAPLDNVAAAARRLEEQSEESLMFVGHLPFMGRLAAYLLTGDAEEEFLHFRTASVACLTGSGDVWQLEWFLDPDLV